MLSTCCLSKWIALPSPHFNQISDLSHNANILRYLSLMAAFFDHGIVPVVILVGQRSCHPLLPLLSLLGSAITTLEFKFWLHKLSSVQLLGYFQKIGNCAGCHNVGHRSKVKGHFIHCCLPYPCTALLVSLPSERHDPGTEVSLKGTQRSRASQRWKVKGQTSFLTFFFFLTGLASTQASEEEKNWCIAKLNKDEWEIIHLIH